jgi:acyl-coenzyme A thioesterase PaaI-like protein
MKQLPHTRSCFVCGESNVRGLNLRSETDGRLVRTRFSFDSQHVGYKGVVHGGLTATLLDEIMTWACAVGAKRFAYCAELVANRRGRVFEAKAELRDQEGTLLATATGKYLPLKDADAVGMSADFVEDPSWVFSAGETAGPAGC